MQRELLCLALLLKNAPKAEMESSSTGHVTETGFEPIALKEPYEFIFKHQVIQRGSTVTNYRHNESDLHRKMHI